MKKSDNLSILFFGDVSSVERIWKRLSDELHCSVQIDSVNLYADFEHFAAVKSYDFIVADYGQTNHVELDILRGAGVSGIPVIFLLETPDIGAALELLDKGAVSCACKDKPDQLVFAIYKARTVSALQRTIYENEHVMREILDNLSDAFYVVDHEWRIQFMNRSAEMVWKCKREDLLGKVFWTCFPVFDDTPVRSMHEAAREKEVETHWEAVSPDRSVWSDISAYPTQNGGLAVFFRDITEHKRAEGILRASEERQAIMLQLSDTLRRLDKPEDIQEAAACIIGKHLGVDTAFYCDVVKLDGVDWFSLNRMYTVMKNNVPYGIHPIDSPGVLANENYEGRTIVVNDIATDPRITDSERQSLRKRNLSAWVSIPLIRNGRFVASFTVHQSVARNWTQGEISLLEETTARTWTEVERVRAEIALKESEKHALQLVAQLENADRNKNEFINSLSHELRNPLAAIVASLSMLDILDHSEDTKKPREIIKRQTDQLCHLVDDLLDLTRITNNKIKLNVDAVDINTLVQSSAVDHITLFSEKDIVLETNICKEPLIVVADPVRISQVIDNLLNNAYKFTDKGGRAVISTKRQDASAVIVVEDNGIGIDASFLPSVFDSFMQAAYQKGGLGLGLSIVKGIVELHGGSVAADSAGLNKGAKFTIKLPLSPGLLTDQEPETKDEPLASKPLRILLIDDNSDLVEMMCSFLLLYGYDVASSYTGLEGVEKARAFQPQVIICDIGLPDIDGYEVARRISALEELRGTYLISLSGYAQASDFGFSKEAGYDMHISKPVNFMTLKHTIETIFDNI